MLVTLRLVECLTPALMYQGYLPMMFSYVHEKSASIPSLTYVGKRLLCLRSSLDLVQLAHILLLTYRSLSEVLIR